MTIILIATAVLTAGLLILATLLKAILTTYQTLEEMELSEL